jgi:hypothetical protein
VRGLIVDPDVRLDLDDPARPPTRAVVADEARPQDRAGRLERGGGEQRAFEDGQR